MEKHVAQRTLCSEVQFRQKSIQKRKATPTKLHTLADHVKLYLQK